MNNFKHFKFLSLLPFVFCVCSCQLLSNYDNSTDSNEASDKTNDEQKVSNPDSIFFDSKTIYVDIDVETTVKFNTLPKKFDTTGFIMSTNHPNILEMVDQEKFLVKGKRRGETTLTISSSDGSVSGSCNVLVGYEDLQDITPSIDTLEYEVGNLLQKKITIKTTPTYAKENIKVRLTTDKRANIAKVERDETSSSITFVVDMTKQYGKGTLLFYDDKDDNNIVSRSEIQKSVPIYAHKYETKPIITNATCTTDGEEKYNCLCGCGKTKTVKIPALNHDFSGEFEYRKKPTCVEGGIEVHKCKHANCNEEHIVEVPACGHTPDLNNKEATLSNRASLASGIRKAQYYYKCSVCSQLAKGCETFGSGNGDFYLKIIENRYKDNPAKLEGLKKDALRLEKMIIENYEKDTIGTFVFKPDYVNVREFGLFFEHIFYYLNQQYTWMYNEKNTRNLTYNKITYTLISSDYASKQKRTEDFDDHFVLLERFIHTQTFITQDSEYLSKLKNLYRFVADYIFYDNYFRSHSNTNSLRKAYVDRSATCGGFANLFRFLCNYYNVDCWVVSHTSPTTDENGKKTTGRHASNAVLYNNKIYYCDPTFGAATVDNKCNNFMRGKDSSKYFTEHYNFEFHCDFSEYLSSSSINFQ